jgi:hypothetical protein
MAIKKKASADAGKPLQSIPFDDDDRKVIMPLVQKIKAGREAERVLSDYIGAIKRRSGVGKEQRISILKDYSRIIVLPDDK